MKPVLISWERRRLACVGGARHFVSGRFSTPRAQARRLRFQVGKNINHNEAVEVDLERIAIAFMVWCGFFTRTTLLGHSAGKEPAPHFPYTQLQSALGRA